MAITSHANQLDFNGDGHTDLLWRGQDGSYVIWNMSADGRQIIDGTFIPNPDPVGNYWHLTRAADFDGDGTTDLLWRGEAGSLVWIMQKDQIASVQAVPDTSVYQHYGFPTIGTMLGIGDFSGDGRTQILWDTTSSLYAVGFPDHSATKLPRPDYQWNSVSIGDFDGDRRGDVLFHGEGPHAGSYMIADTTTDGTLRLATFADPGAFWSVNQVADFNGDGKADILWRGQDGTPVIWLMDNEKIIGGNFLPNPGDFWTPIDAQDFNSDGKADILWRGQDGTLVEWNMDGAQFQSIGMWAGNPGNFWSPVI